jgi:hypothetical protein
MQADEPVPYPANILQMTSTETDKRALVLQIFNVHITYIVLFYMFKSKQVNASMIFSVKKVIKQRKKVLVVVVVVIL